MILKIILFCICICNFIFCEDLQEFKLKNGTKIKGEIASENELFYEVNSRFGLVQIDKKDIKKMECKFFLNDGNVMVGNKISSSKEQVIIETEMGVFKIKKDDYYLCIPSINNDIYFILMFIIAIF